MPCHILTLESYRERQAAFVAELELEPEFKILITLLSLRENTAVNAVQQINDLIALVEGSKNDGCHIYNTACCVLEIAVRMAPEQPKLVSFVHELQKTTVLNGTTGKPLVFDEECETWRDLPTFEFKFGDELQIKGKLETSSLHFAYSSHYSGYILHIKIL